jgi:hypothetical protein
MKHEMKYRVSEDQKLNKFVGDTEQCTIAFSALISKHKDLKITVRQLK